MKNTRNNKHAKTVQSQAAKADNKAAENRMKDNQNGCHCDGDCNCGYSHTKNHMHGAKNNERK